LGKMEKHKTKQNQKVISKKILGVFVRNFHFYEY